MITSLRIALNALKKNKVRTALTVLGIVIGITAVIVVMSAGESMKAFLVQQVEVFGSDFIEVEIKVPATKHASAENALGQAMGITITTLKLDDMEEINKLPNIKESYGGVMGQELASFGGEQKQAVLWGVSASFYNIDTGEVSAGRFFTDEEDRSLANLVVLGSAIKENLFADAEAIGKLIKLGKQKYKVIGVMEERGASFGFSMDEMIFVPVRTLQKKIMGIDHLQFIISKVYDNDIADQTAEEIRRVMREQHDISDPNKDDFGVITMDEMLEMMDTITGAVTLLLIALASISLIVGGVGIMNIMYVSVTERSFEIGLRQAVGARKAEILWQFLWEAVAVTFLGAVVGVLVGVLIVWGMAFGAQYLGFSWPFVITWQSIITAVGFTGAVGLLFGIWPAREAAGLDPIEALRK